MNALPTGFEAKALKFYYRLGGRKSVAVFVPKGFNPEKLTIQLSRRIEPEDKKNGILARSIKAITGHAGIRMSTTTPSLAMLSASRST